MSAALATPIPASAPADLHATPAAQRRRTLQDRAWDLSCQGLRAPAIADALGVPQRTVRSWLTAIRHDVADDLREQHADALLLAVESIRHVAATAWVAYEREADREIVASASTTPTRDRRASQAPRYLTLALAAHVQAARLLGLYRKDAQAAYDAALTSLAVTIPSDEADELPESAESAESTRSAASIDPDDFPLDAPPPHPSAESAETLTTDPSADTTALRNPTEPPTHSPLPPHRSPHGPFPRGEGGRGLGPSHPHPKTPGTDANLVPGCY